MESAYGVSERYAWDRSVDMREVVNGILCLSRTGCSWRQLPHEFPPWGTTHYYYRRFRLDGMWQLIHNKLREKVHRMVGKKPTPSAAVIDSSESMSHIAIINLMIHRLKPG